MIELSIDFGTAFAGLAVLILALKMEDIVKILKNCNGDIDDTNNNSSDKDGNC